MVIFWPTLFARFTGRKFYSVFKVQAPYFSHDFVVCNHNALPSNILKVINPTLLDNHHVAAAAAKDFERIHLLGFGGRDDKTAGGGGAGSIVYW